jgi:ATP-dependent protease ClpP protease subunit
MSNKYLVGKNKQKNIFEENAKNEDPLPIPLKSLLNGPSMSEKERNHIYFYNDVDQDTCLDLNRKIHELNKELLKYAIDYETEPPSIYIHINSHGGSLFAAFSTIDTIINSRIPIISIVEGSAASAATVISMVCHKRYMTPNSFMLIHQLSTCASGKYEEMKDDFINDTALMDHMYKLYLEHTTMNLKKIKNALKHDLWWDATKCLENGLIDDIYKGDFANIQLKKHFNSEIFNSSIVSDLKTLGNRNKKEMLDSALKSVSLSKRKRIDQILEESDTEDEEKETKDSTNKTNNKTNTNKNKKKQK